jgi:hypothetical protein
MMPGSPNVASRELAADDLLKVLDNCGVRVSEFGVPITQAALGNIVSQQTDEIP